MSRTMAIDSILAEYLYGDVYNDTNKELKSNVILLQHAAKQFLNAVNVKKFDKTITTHRQKLKKALQDNKKFTINDINKLERPSNVLKNKTFLQLVLAFQKAINNFMGISITMTWVDKDGNAYIIEEADELSLLNKSSFDEKRLRYDISQVSNIKNNTDISKWINNNFTEEEEREQYNTHFSNLRTLYATILNNEKETQNNIESDKTPTVVKQKTADMNRLFLVYNTDKFYFNIFTNWGVFNEGYIGALMQFKNDTVRSQFNNNNNNERAKVLYDDYISKADSMPGAFGGDVKIYGSTTELAVKSGSFSSQSYGILIDIAQWISKVNITTLDRESFINGFYQRNKKNKDPNFVKKFSQLNKKIDETVKKEIEDYMIMNFNLNRDNIKIT